MAGRKEILQGLRMNGWHSGSRAGSKTMFSILKVELAIFADSLGEGCETMRGVFKIKKF